jgi:hypothetical protein
MSNDSLGMSGGGPDDELNINGDGEGDDDEDEGDHRGRRHHDGDDDDDEMEQQEWPSPAELLADARSVLAAADAEVLRDGKPPPPEAMVGLYKFANPVYPQLETAWFFNP